MLEELNFTYKWLETHVSDHSAANHRSQVIQNIVQILLRDSDESTTSIPATKDPYFSSVGKTTMCNFLGNILSESSSLITHRPGNETLWYHRRGVMQIALQILSSTNPGSGYGDSISTDEVVSDCEKSLTEIAALRTSQREMMIFNHNTVNLDEMQKALLGFVSHELKFIESILRDGSAWNHDKQSCYCTRYLAFLFYSVRFIQLTIFD